MSTVRTQTAKTQIKNKEEKNNAISLNKTHEQMKTNQQERPAKAQRRMLQLLNKQSSAIIQLCKASTKDKSKNKAQTTNRKTLT